MIYQDPLAYLLGLEGIALLDAWAGDHDRAFTQARLAEIRRLLDDEQLRDRGVLVEQVSAATVYEQVSAGYDAEAGGGLFATDEPVVAEYLASREAGVALDAACGTGRFAEFLDRRGHRVIGVDSSPDMLAHARRRVPHAGFHVAELDRLPLPDDCVDVIVCALALEHVPRLDPVLAEFARVLRPGGDLVVSDVHHETITRGSVMTTRGPAGEPRIAPTYRHQLGDYLRAALRNGLQVRRCEEPRVVRADEPLPEPATEIGDWQDWPFSLTDYLPSAGRASGGRPHLVIWHFRLPGRPDPACTCPQVRHPRPQARNERATSPVASSEPGGVAGDVVCRAGAGTERVVQGMLPAAGGELLHPLSLARDPGAVADGLVDGAGGVACGDLHVLPVVLVHEGEVTAVGAADLWERADVELAVVAAGGWSGPELVAAAEGLVRRQAAGDGTGDAVAGGAAACNTPTSTTSSSAVGETSTRDLMQAR